MQYKYAICNTNMQYIYAVQARNKNMQHAIQICRTDKQQRYAIQICDPDMQYRCAMKIQNPEKNRTNRKNPYQDPFGDELEMSCVQTFI